MKKKLTVLDTVLDLESFKIKYGLPRKYSCRVLTMRCKNPVKGILPLYLDIYKEGKRKRCSCGALIFPERTKQDEDSNQNAWAVAKIVAEEVNVKITKEGAGFKDVEKEKVYLEDVMQEYEDKRKVDGRETERGT